MSDATFSPDPQAGKPLMDAHVAAADALRTGAAAVSVTSGPSTGKTALCHALAEGAGDRAFTAVLTDPSIDPDALLHRLLGHFGLSAGISPHGQTHDHLTLSAPLVQFLKSLKPLSAHALLIIDDADQVGVDVYERLLQLAQAAGSDGTPLRLVLVGQPLLDARLAEPPLNEFPISGGQWIRLGATQDDPFDVAPAQAAPEIDVPAIAVPEPAVDSNGSRAEKAPARSPRVLALAALLVVALIVVWWTTRRPEPATTDAPPAVPQANPAPASTPAPAPTVRSGAPATATAAPPSGKVQSPAPARDATSSGGTGASASVGASYRITVASFKTAARAQQIASELTRQQLAVATRTDASNTWHQVVAGPYTSIDDAREAQRRLERAGFSETQISLAPPASDR